MSNSTLSKISWKPILDQMQIKPGQSLPTYPGNLKAALFNYAGVNDHPKREEVYQIAQELARLTTECDPEITYWFSRLVSLIEP